MLSSLGMGAVDCQSRVPLALQGGTYKILYMRATTIFCLVESCTQHAASIQVYRTTICSRPFTQCPQGWIKI